MDVPSGILAQLGLKYNMLYEHLQQKTDNPLNRPLTIIRPPSINTSEVLTSLGIGEALVTALNEKGIPTPCGDHDAGPNEPNGYFEQKVKYRKSTVNPV
jgi:hypothetical protein